VSELANAAELEEEPASVDPKRNTVRVQQASAKDGWEYGDGGDISFCFEQDQSNRCSGYAYWSNYGEIEYGEE
jgi:hypothetical protein